METAKPVRRNPPRRFSAEFKAQLLAECDQPGALITQVAARHGVRPGLLHKWRQSLRGERSARAGTPGDPARQMGQIGQFVSVPLTGSLSGSNPAGTSDPLCTHIHIDIQRASGVVHIRWPLSDAAHCSQWLNAVLT